MLKRWFSVKKKSKEDSNSSQQSGVSNNVDVSNNQSQTPYHTPRMSPESKPIPKPTPIRTKDRNMVTSPGHSNKLQSPAAERPPPGDTHSGNETLPSLLSTSIETVMDMDPPILFTTSTENMPYGDGSNKVFGFENFGNTCYCNSVLQCLYNMTEFRIQMLQHPERNSNTRRKRKVDMPGRKPRFFNEASFDHRPNNNNNNGVSGNAVNTKRDSEGSNNGHHNPVTNEHTQATSANNIKSVEIGNNHESNDQDDTNSSTVNSKSRSASSNYQNSNKPYIEGDKPPPSNGHQPSAKPSRPNEGTNGSTKDTNVPNIVIAGTQPVHATLTSANSCNEKIHENTQKVIVGRNDDLSSHGPAELHPTAASNHKTGGSDIEKHSTVESHDLSSSTAHTAKLTLQRPQSRQSQHSQHLQQHHSSHNNPLSTEQRKKAALIKGPVLNVDHLLHESGESNLYTGLKDIFECITENLALTGVVSPIKFVDILKKENVLFNTTMHQDAHEFLNFLLNELSDYLNNGAKSGKDDEEHSLNFIKDIFQGTLTNRVKCFTCDNITSRDEPFLDFPIEVPDDSETDIQALLQNFDQREMLSGPNKFYCNVCCGLQEAERSVGLKQLPHTLALHLKRFKYSETKNSNIKLFNKVHYPLTLDVCSTYSNSVCKKYELSGIVVHMGGGPQHGHYVSLCKNDNFGWLLFDDETVESVSEKTVLDFVGDSSTLTTAYVLFYRELPFYLENTSTGLDSKKHYDENIEKLLKYDEWLRANSSKTTSMSETNPAVEATTKEPPMAPPAVPHVEREASTTSVKTARPKSRLFNFMKS
ncbi:ZYRO0B03300p [Zygosaccharomyces rouxii]|uniref:Ubiquitin carboxyl-terminal hydrolase n=1 Tax=Zygosaccharomyces rouxii (strain ATCC 2623 / CBS 732 / NBRC 1130 / NCYC 568 / NRRL Y-229) TaxID=559307 RepID=C5DQV5_ZYGRC|nr:uncharacterized protein ZYRO0B03300g [Zygosaccharomyces rouxii]KAH9200285.1 hypothetical protein LQ764DRAFT_114321 [Zygosaccharomyces rouxii]CAR26166.1 ZYRO0B03300p [Zygosaccharomyces rouxii]